MIYFQIIVFLFHVVIAGIFLGLALSLMSIKNESIKFIDADSETVMYLQFGRALAYGIISICQLYSELVIGRMRSYWK